MFILLTFYDVLQEADALVGLLFSLQVLPLTLFTLFFFKVTFQPVRFHFHPLEANWALSNSTLYSLVSALLIFMYLYNFFNELGPAAFIGAQHGLVLAILHMFGELVLT